MNMIITSLILHLLLVPGLSKGGRQDTESCKFGKFDVRGKIKCEDINTAINITTIKVVCTNDSCSSRATACPWKALNPSSEYKQNVTEQCNGKNRCSFDISSLGSTFAQCSRLCCGEERRGMFLDIRLLCARVSSGIAGGRTTTAKSSTIISCNREREELWAPVTTLENPPKGTQQGVTENFSSDIIASSSGKESSTGNSQLVVLGVSMAGGFLLLIVIAIVIMLFIFKKTPCQQKSTRMNVARNNGEGEGNNGHVTIETTDSGGYMEIELSTYSVQQINNDNQRTDNAIRCGTLSSVDYQGPDIVNCD